MRSQIFGRFGLAGGWVQEVLTATIALASGFGVLPLLIYFAGSMALGRYEGASPARIYQGIYEGLRMGSSASWIVVLGPYGLYLIFKCLRLWWRVSAKLA
jgi:hypothetical protein